MGILTEMVKGYFEANNWEYECSPTEEGLFLAGIEAENTEFDVVIHADDDINQITCFCIHQDTVPEEKLNDVAEYMTRVNFSNVFVAYDMDFDDGEIRMRASMNLADMKPTPDMLDTLIQNTLSFADIYYPGLIAVLEDESSPKEALDECLSKMGDMVDEDEE
ncbi:MAG TPA: YbjN domain-containing protein [Candidatus Hydrogenedentes bacterium]|nr:YbjN domain-containing protein [Candidatus Hydrogenedentota bacterium]